MSDQAAAQTRARWVTALIVLCLIASALAILSQIFFPREPTFVRYFDDFSWAELTIRLGLFAMLVTAAILLRRSRREALWFVAAVFLVAGATVARRLLTRDIGGLIDYFGLLGLILVVFWIGLVFVLSGVILAYVWGLKRQGGLS
jgi:hypothetical protein